MMSGMCGRMTSTSADAALATYFVADKIVTDDDFEPSYNLGPTRSVRVIAEHAEERRLGVMRWGLVPFFSKSVDTRARMFNARAETVMTSPTFREPFAKRRCIVCIDGFYEWEAVPKSLSAKQPWYFVDKDNRPLGLAGLWDRWRDPQKPDAKPLVSCTIITTTAGDDMHGVHDRMPLVLTAEHWDRWLDRSVTAPEDVGELLATPGTGLLKSWPVSRAVNSVRNDEPSLIDEIHPEQ